MDIDRLLNIAMVIAILALIGSVLWYIAALPV